MKPLQRHRDTIWQIACNSNPTAYCKLTIHKHYSSSHNADTIQNGSQSPRHTINSSHRKIVWRVDWRVWRRCDELAVLFELEFLEFKSFTIVSDFYIAHIKPK